MDLGIKTPTGGRVRSCSNVEWPDWTAAFKLRQYQYKMKPREASGGEGRMQRSYAAQPTKSKKTKEQPLTFTMQTKKRGVCEGKEKEDMYITREWGWYFLVDGILARRVTCAYPCCVCCVVIPLSIAPCCRSGPKCCRYRYGPHKSGGGRRGGVAGDVGIRLQLIRRYVWPAAPQLQIIAGGHIPSRKSSVNPPARRAVKK
jgi:hypothetical protein